MHCQVSPDMPKWNIRRVWTQMGCDESSLNAGSQCDVMAMQGFAPFRAAPLTPAASESYLISVLSFDQVGKSAAD